MCSGFGKFTMKGAWREGVLSDFMKDTLGVTKVARS